MGLYIPNVEMPKSCDDCPHPTCTLWQSVNGGERNEKCPLVELPPHGRLVDADALIKDGWTLRKEAIRMGGYVTHELPLNNPSIPTIIESTIGQLNSDSAVNKANANTSNALNALDYVEESEASR